MTDLKIAILGASGIGKFHAHEYKSLDCDIVAILGSTKERAKKTASMLCENFGINAKPYHELEKLLEEKIDAVSICTPPELHEQQVRKCLERGLNVLCEKPFVQGENNYQEARELAKLAEEKNKILTINTQWPSVIPAIGDYADLARVKSFSMSMEPGVKCKEMIIDSLPHMNSMLIALIPNGKPEKISFPKREDEDIEIKFNYVFEKGECEVKYNFRYKTERPRNIGFGINGVSFVREVGENYKQKLVCNGKSIEIEDPLKVSVRSFIEAIGGRGKPLISEREILENVYLQERIIKEFLIQLDFS